MIILGRTGSGSEAVPPSFHSLYPSRAELHSPLPSLYQQALIKIYILYTLTKKKQHLSRNLKCVSFLPWVVTKLFCSYSIFWNLPFSACIVVFFLQDSRKTYQAVYEKQQINLEWPQLVIPFSMVINLWECTIHSHCVHLGTSILSAICLWLMYSNAHLICLPFLCLIPLLVWFALMK